MIRLRSDFVGRSIMGALGFLKDAIFADSYAAQKGFLQARDPRLKTLSILFLALAVLFSRSIALIAGIYLLCLALAAISAINPAFFLKRTWLFIPVFSLCIAFPAIFNTFTPGPALATFRLFGVEISITRTGLAGAGIFFLRVLTSVSLCVLLALTTRHYALLKTLRVFGVAQIFVITLGMCYRYIYLFIELIQNTYIAIKSRCGYLSSARKGQGLVAWNIAALWQRSYQLHLQVYNAMLSRGFDGEPRVMENFQTTAKDIFWLAATVFLFLVSIWQAHSLN